ncbi:MAG: hypothetical protein Q4C70_13635, partial [Planctomycetia bacterium]|nr:hypothetical protein [Planctomycetia bacterium]
EKETEKTASILKSESVKSELVKPVEEIYDLEPESGSESGIEDVKSDAEMAESDTDSKMSEDIEVSEDETEEEDVTEEEEVW